MKNKLKIFILLSVVLNVLLIGVLLGQLYGRIGVSSPGQQIATFLDRTELPPDRRALMRERMEGIFGQQQMRWERVRELREESLQILTAENFDAEAYRDKLDTLFAVRGEHHQRMTEMITDLATELSQSEREALAEVLRRPAKGRFSGRRSPQQWRVRDGQGRGGLRR